MSRKPMPREIATRDQILSAAYGIKGMHADLDMFIRKITMYDESASVDTIRIFCNNLMAQDGTWDDRDGINGRNSVVASFIGEILHKTHNYRGFTYTVQYDYDRMTWHQAHAAGIVANYDRYYL